MAKIKISEKEGIYPLEAFKTLRTNISFCGDDIKVIAVTSSFPNEGKSEVSLRLAYAFAETGAKTVLLDADIRNSVLPGRLGISDPKIGLSHLLSGKEKDLHRAISKTAIPELDVIFTGPAAPNPSELLGSSRFTKLIETLKSGYEYVIVDCPPVIPVIDAAIVAKICDGTIMVIAQDEVKKHEARKAAEQLRLSGTRLLGTVLNKVHQKGKGYGYGKYGYGYGRAN